MATNDLYNLAAGYGFQEPPDEEMIRALMGQLRMGNQAEAAQPRLEKQMSRAEALRDRPAPRSTHWLSGLAHLGNKAAGIRDVRATEAEQKSGEGSLANSLAAQQQYQMNAQSRKENSALAKTRLEMDQTKTLAAANKSEFDQEMAYKYWKARQGDGAVAEGPKIDKPPSGVIDLKTGDNRNVYYDKNSGNFLDRVTKEVVDPETFKQYGPSSLGTGKERNTMTQAPVLVKNASEFHRMDDAEWDLVAQPMKSIMEDGIPTKLMNDAIATGENSGVFEWMSKQGIFNNTYDDAAKDAIRHSIQVYNRLHTVLINPYLEEVNTGPVAKDDAERLLGAINITKGQTGAMMGNNVRTLTGSIMDRTRATTQKGLETGDQEFYWNAREAEKSLKSHEMMTRAGRGVTLGGTKKWIGALKEMTPEAEAKIQALVSSGMAGPDLLFALEEVKRRAAEMKK